MIKFIIYEKEEQCKSYYEMVILNFIGRKEEKYKIVDYNSEENIKHDQKIYILSSNKTEEALNKAKEIRNNNDWSSQIIIISNLKGIKKNILINRLLVLDYIDINSDIKDRLKDTLYQAYYILNSNKTLNYIMNGEINKIPYNDILYIEKGNNQNYCTINTLDNKYIIKTTINNLEKKLDSTYFMKTHRSCIVNIYNINNYNYSTNTVNFINDTKIDLIAREKKKILKQKLIKNK